MTLVFILGLIGFFVFGFYSIKKKNEAAEANRRAYQREAKLIKCPSCGSQVSERARACPSCGHPIDTKIYCPNCHGTNVKQISGLAKGASVAAFGVFAANTVKSSYQCYDCGTKF